MNVYRCFARTVCVPAPHFHCVWFIFSSHVPITWRLVKTVPRDEYQMNRNANTLFKTEVDSPYNLRDIYPYLVCERNFPPDTIYFEPESTLLGDYHIIIVII